MLCYNIHVTQRSVTEQNNRKENNMNIFKIYLARTGERKQIDTFTSEYVKETDVEREFFELHSKYGDEYGIIHDCITKGYYILAERAF